MVDFDKFRLLLRHLELQYENMCSLPFRVNLFGWHEIPESFQQQINGHHLVLFPPDETS